MAERDEANSTAPYPCPSYFFRARWAASKLDAKNVHYSYSGVWIST